MKDEDFGPSITDRSDFLKSIKQRLLDVSLKSISPNQKIVLVKMELLEFLLNTDLTKKEANDLLYEVFEETIEEMKKK